VCIIWNIKEINESIIKMFGFLMAFLIMKYTSHVMKLILRNAIFDSHSQHKRKNELCTI